jgi:hypothetical protein
MFKFNEIKFFCTDLALFIPFTTSYFGVSSILICTYLAAWLWSLILNALTGDALIVTWGFAGAVRFFYFKCLCFSFIFWVKVFMPMSGDCLVFLWSSFTLFRNILELHISMSSWYIPTTGLGKFCSNSLACSRIPLYNPPSAIFLAEPFILENEALAPVDLYCECPPAYLAWSDRSKKE